MLRSLRAPVHTPLGNKYIRVNFAGSKLVVDIIRSTTYNEIIKISVQSNINGTGHLKWTVLIIVGLDDDKDINCMTVVFLRHSE